MTNIPTKIEIETRLASLSREMAWATDDAARDRIGRDTRLHETALLELFAAEEADALRDVERKGEAVKEKARQHIRAASAQGKNIVAHLAALLAGLGIYKSEMVEAVKAWPRLKSSAVSGDTLMQERELLKAIAAELIRAGIRLPQGGFNSASDARPLAEKIRQTERALLGAIDGFSALYEVAAELEPVR